MIAVSKIKATKHYDSLDGIRKIFLTKKVTVKSIELGCNMTRLTSFDNWVRVCSPRHDVKQVVLELTK